VKLARGVGVVVLLGLSSPALAQGNGQALETFVGSWKEDASKRAGAVSLRFPLRFQTNKAGVLEELRGPEASPTAQPVQFDSKPHVLPSGNTSTWKQIDAHTFEQVRSDAKGVVVSTRRLVISTDGNSLTEVTEARANDRTTTTKAVYGRAAGAGSGLIGRWEPTSLELNADLSLKIEVAGPNTVRFSGTGAPTYELVLDGEPRQSHGTATPAMQATTTSGRLLADSIEERVFRNNIEWSRSVYAVSADGKTMTVTVTNLGAGPTPQPSVFVFVRQ